MNKFKFYLKRSEDLTRSSSLLIALLAKTKNSIAPMGKNIPMPFSTIYTDSLDKFRERKTNNVSKIKFKITDNLLRTN